MRGFAICKKSGLNTGAWSLEEDAKLSSYIKRFGIGNWGKIPEYAGLKRCGKSCRLRWLNYLQPGLKRGNFSREEEELIVNLHQKLGNRWSKIAANLQGRSDNEVKNYWHTHLKDRSKNNTRPKGVKKKPKSASKSLSKGDIASFGSFVLESSSFGLLPQQNTQAFSLTPGNEFILGEERNPEPEEEDIWPKMLELESMLEIMESLPKLDVDDDDPMIITKVVVQKQGFEFESGEDITSVLDFPESPKSPNDISPLTVGDEVVMMEKATTNESATLLEFNLDWDNYSLLPKKLVVLVEAPILEGAW